jgi:hypothetical protein
MCAPTRDDGRREHLTMERIMATSRTRSTTRRRTSAQTASEPESERRPPAATTPKKKKTAPKKPAAMTPTEHIRVRAYYLSLERNGCAADPIADWLRAERELTTGTEA